MSCYDDDPRTNEQQAQDRHRLERMNQATPEAAPNDSFDTSKPFPAFYHDRYGIRKQELPKP